MTLTKEERGSITQAGNISETISKKLKETDEGVKEGVDLIALAKKLAKRKIENEK